MHPTRRELFRMGLGSSALLACGSTVPMFLGSLGCRPGWRWSGRGRRGVFWSWSSLTAATMG